MSAMFPPKSPPSSFSDYDVEGDPNLLIRRILALASLSVNARLRDIDGPTESQWRPLHWLYARGSLRVIELARLCEIDPAGMTRLIDRLEHKGLCRRSRSASDRRVVEVFLTDAGLESAKRVTPVLERIQVELLMDFDTEQQRNLLRLLARLANNAQSCGQALTRSQ
ncbi:MarR family winged helix-turn-helix transcriptional regulator [Variovorax sp. Varisp62]|uniref:MarR family winged helix-turn-helix transcriptional regulator n=1 Tax=Variovorax sp. Varisp62 TaxID=3243049 RepID=UPI0039B5E4B7